MTSPLELGTKLVDTDKVSFVGDIDTKIKHDTIKSTTIYFITLIVDGHQVDIQDHNRKVVEDFRTLVFNACYKGHSKYPGI